MAADGAWPHKRRSGAEAGPPPDDLLLVLAALERRLDDGEAMSPGAARALAQALDLLSTRIAQQEATVLAAGARAARPHEDGSTPRITRRDPWPIRALLTASGALAAVSTLGALAVVGLSSAPRSEGFAPVEATVRHGPLPTPAATNVPVEKADASTPAGRAAPSAAPGGSADTYEAAVTALQRGEPQALARVSGLAQAGETRAQLLLAGLYETGGSGLPRDLTAARVWTRRAAGGGDSMAMHNLGLFLMEGEGGPRDVVEAAAWFRRAAERGVVDSQYNLGLLHEAGQGVPRNLREAYRWFSVAANAGDLVSRGKQVEMEARLTLAERASVGREVANFQPGAHSPDAAALIVSPAASIAESQTFLARRGYYLGAIDGAPSAGYATAVAAWRNDHPESR